MDHLPSYETSPARGCRVQGGVRLQTLADVIAHLDHVRAPALMDATEIRVRRPTAKRAGQGQFISGKSRTNAVKALVITDVQGRLLFCGATVRGSTADITQAHQAGLVDWLNHTNGVQILTDAGYQGLGAQTRGQVITPTLRHHKKALERMPGIAELRQAQRREHAQRRVRVEHGIAHLKNWRSLARHHGRREITTPRSAPSPAYCPTLNTPTAVGPSPPSPPAR
ncbi:transposase [Micromonospora sp. KC721]|nr:transposase [Micromonospora sp. KC721]